MEGERRRGMDDVARTMGRLEAGLAAISQRQDSLQIERNQQHTEGLRVITDVQAQAHEIKHAQNNQDMRIVALDAKIAGHQEFTKNSVARLEGMIHEHLQQNASQFGAITARIEELSAWRHWVMGGLALIGMALVVLGQHIWDSAMHLLSGPRK